MSSEHYIQTFSMSNVYQFKKPKSILYIAALWVGQICISWALKATPLVKNFQKHHGKAKTALASQLTTIKVQKIRLDKRLSVLDLRISNTQMIHLHVLVDQLNSDRLVRGVIVVM